MKKAFLCAIIALFSLFNCQKPAETGVEAGCQPPASLLAHASCETNYPGVLLQSAEYTVNDETQFIYYVYPQQDTLSNNVATTAVSWANASQDRIVVPETAIRNAPKFLARVSVNCQGKELFSRYFAFVKRPAGPTCYRWVMQNQ